MNAFSHTTAIEQKNTPKNTATLEVDFHTFFNVRRNRGRNDFIDFSYVCFSFSVVEKKGFS
jgi:hypothetical protein